MITVEKPGSPEELVHFGKKGMRWGVRNESRSSGGSGGAKKGPGRLKRAARAAGRGADNTLFELGTQNSRVIQSVTLNAGAKLSKDLPGIKAKHGDYGKLRNRVKHPFSPQAKAYRADVKKSYLKHLETAANEHTNIRGTRNYTLVEKGKPNTKQYSWTLKTQSVKHADDDEGTFTVRPIFDDEGYITSVELVDDDMAQTMEVGLTFLIHMGLEV